MASDQDFVDYVCEQAALGKALTFRRMFGEYALYVHGKVVAFVCDNQVFAKPLDVLRPLLAGEPDLAPPYPGAKMYFRLAAELDQPEVLQRLLLATADALPPPKEKKVKAAKAAPATGAKSRPPAKAGAPKKAHGAKAASGTAATRKPPIQEAIAKTSAAKRAPAKAKVVAKKAAARR